MTKQLEFRLEAYDDDGTLRVGPLLWLAMLFLGRHALLLLLGGLSTFVGLSSEALSKLYSAPIFLIASAPALAVALAAIRRAPKAGRTVRLVWRQGRLWLATAALVDGLLPVTRLATTHLALSEWLLLWLLLDVYVLAYLGRSRRVKAVFADFPAPAMRGKQGG